MSNLYFPKQRNLTKRVTSSPEDLLTDHTLVGNKIKLKNLAYVIDSKDYFNGTNYTFFSDVDVAIMGYSQAINKIVNNSNGIDLIEVDSANLFLKEIELEATGTGSQAIKMTGTGSESLDMNTVAFANNTKYGTLINLRQGFLTNGFSFGAKEGFLLQGAWEGFTLFNSRIINTGGYILKGDAGLTIDSIRSNVNCDIQLGDVAFDFDFDMFNIDEGYQLEGGRYNGDGAMVSDFTTGDKTEAWRSRKSYFKGNKGVLSKNTNIGGTYRVTSEINTPLTQNVLTKLLGVTTASSLEHMVSNNNNQLTHNSSVSKCYYAFVNAVVDNQPNQELVFSIQKENNLGSPIEELFSQTRRVSNVQGGQDVAYFNIATPCFELQQNESIGLYITNISSNSTAVLKIDSDIYLKE